MNETSRGGAVSEAAEASTMTAIDVGKGDVVVLGHSYLWDAEMWRPQIDVLSQRYRVIAPNLWGHADSGRLPQGTVDLNDIARQHLRLLDRLGVDRFAIVGLSVGGMWGAELACLVPERVTAIALLDTFVGPEPAASRERYYAMLNAIEVAGRVPEQVLDAIVPLFFSPRSAEAAREYRAAFRAKLVAWDRDRLLDTIVPLGRMIFGRREMISDLADLIVPSIVMTGADDIPRPPHEGRLMAEALGCRFVELPGAGHISTLESPDAVNEELSAFLADALA